MDGSVQFRFQLDDEDRDRHIFRVQNWEDPERWTVGRGPDPGQLDQYVPRNPPLLVDGISWAILTRPGGPNRRPATMVIGPQYRDVEEGLYGAMLGTTTQLEELDRDSRTWLDVAGYDEDRNTSHGRVRFQEPMRWAPEQFLYFGCRYAEPEHGGAAFLAKLHYREE